MKTFEVTQDYNREDFLAFLSDFLPEDYIQEEEQTFYDYTNIEDGYKLGTCDSLDLDVFEFLTKSERDPRVTLTREVVSFMKKYGSNQNALVVFYSNESHNWRLSLITTDYEVVNGKVKPLYSNPRRFSFRLGGECKAHTPQTMLFKKGQICEHTENGKTVTPIEDLKNRFALEVVSKQFFDEYKVFYEDFVQYITGNRYIKVGGKYERKPVSKENTKIFNQFKKLANDDYELACKYVRDYIKKFMGRLVFLQFLQKKGWLGVDQNESWGNGNKNFLLDLFTSSNKKNDFLEKVLEPLFFGMLNTDFDDRKSLFKQREWDIALLDEFRQIPYLNGGLFEDDALDHLEIKFPQEMFSNPSKTDKERTFNDKKDYTKEPYPFTESCGLLDFFARYNFTIDETDPADMEIGVEPEMLGKIFENLLEDNKDKGAFYTPKEIVQYMCRESLIAYLGDNEKIRELVITHNSEFDDSEKKVLIKKLQDVKVCDPAVGSGAFPMGMLNELFACRVALGDNEESAEIKKQIVRENIYGVDIEKGAVDIARLRFWLAIIVDEKEPIPLPNLDYKIMQGNSLLECYNGIDLSHMLEAPAQGEFDYNEEQRTLLKTNMNLYFDDNNHKDKTKKNDIIKSLVYDLASATCGFSKNGKDDLELHEKIWDGTTDFFLWHTWFSDVFNRPNDCNGFDIVIGNPPYIPLQDNKGLLADIYENKNFKVYDRGGDIYSLFYEQGTGLLHSKGILSYITSSQWLRAGYGQKLREYLAVKMNPTLLIDFTGVKVFDATVDPCIILLLKEDNKNKTVATITKPYGKEILPELVKFVNQNASECAFSDGESWIILSKPEQDLKNKIKNNGTPLKSLGINLYRGILTGFNDAFIIPTEKRDEIISKCKTKNEKDMTEELIKPVLRGRDIRKNGYIENGLFQINTHNGVKESNIPRIKIEEYPAVKNHLDSFFEKLSKRSDKGDTPYNLRNCAYLEDFSKPKIIYPETTVRRSEFYYDESGILLDKTCFFMSGNNLKFIQGILTSKVIEWYLERECRLLGKTTIQYSKQWMENIPIPTATIEQEKTIIDLVNKILSEKKDNPQSDASDLELEIDNLVYKLYGLTDEEISIIVS